MTLEIETHLARLPELGGSERDCFALLEVRAQQPAGSDRVAQSDVLPERAPLCLAIAIDASSSMRGPRFALALQATRDVIASLSSFDRLAVITFDKTARVVVAPTRLDGEGTAQALRALDRLSTGIGTNIGAGWREASEAVLRVMAPGVVRRVLVLTDGFPSRGDTQRDALKARVAEGRSRGVETSVVGLGDGIDESLCADLAESGEGRFHYVRDEGGLGDVVVGEVEGAKSLAARDVSILLTLTPRVERAEVLHRYPCRPEGRTIEVRIGAVTRDSPRRVLVGATLGPGTPDAMLGVAMLRGVRAAGAPVSEATAQGYALGRVPASPTDDAIESDRVSLMLSSTLGDDESRRAVAHEFLTLRTLAEVRSAWDALDVGDREAVTRRLERARSMRKLLTEKGLVDPTKLGMIPDVDVVQQAMFAAGGEAREARRRFTSWAHNTQHSFIGMLAPPGPPAPVPPRKR